MVDQFTGNVGTILVDNGKGGRCDDVRYSQLFANGFDESGFSCSHFPVEGKDGIVAHGFDELAGGFVNLV